MKTLQFLFLLLLCLLMYWPHKGGGFVMDDYFIVVQNPVIKSPARWKEAFQQDLLHTYKSSGIFKLPYYRPLVTLSHMIDYRFWRLNAFGYRMFNIFIHWLNACLVYGLVLLLFRDKSLSFLCALLFAAHPVHEWAVAFISSRGDLLQFFFSLLCLIALVQSWSGRRRWWCAGMFFFICALLSKEASVLLPGYIFLLSLAHSRQWKKALIAALPFAAISAVYLLLREMYLPLLGIYAGHSPDFIFSKWLVFSTSYFLRLFIPWSLYTYLPPLFHEPVFMVLVVSALFGDVLLTLVKKKFGAMTIPATLGFWWLSLSMASLAPALPFIAYVGPTNAEHYLYFPSVGFVLIIGSMIRNLPAPWLRRLIITGICLYFLALGLMNRQDWRSEQAILERLRAKDPDPDSLAARELALRFEPDEERIAHFIEVSERPRKETVWLKRMGYVLHQKGDYEGAIDYLKKAVEVYPDNMDAVNELAMCYFEQGRYDEGFASVSKALLQDPEHPDSNQIVGMAYYRTGQFKQAAHYLQKVRLAAPENINAGFFASMALHLAGNEPSGESMDRFIKDSEDPVLLIKMTAHELFDHGRIAEALDLLNRAPTITGADVDFYRLTAPEGNSASGNSRPR